MQAEDVYLLTAETINGTTGNYNVPSNHKFTNSSGTEYTYTITSMPATGFSFRIGVKGQENNMQPNTDGYALTINGDSYTISDKCYGTDKAWKVSYTDGEYTSLTITVDLSTSSPYVKITGVKSSSGGGTMNVVLTPVTAIVPFRTSLTPKVDVVGTDNKTRRYAYTLDGTDPVIDAETGNAAKNSTTVVVHYDYDPVIPTNDLPTFSMEPDNNIYSLKPEEGDQRFPPVVIHGDNVTVKVQAVAVSSDGNTDHYSLQGDVVTGNYTFKPLWPQATYTLNVTNNEPVSVNKATATVEVTNTTTHSDDGVDVYYTTDGSDPTKSLTARLVRDRKVTLYAQPGEVGKKGTLKVAIPNTTVSASCEYDITYSTSEGGYLSYMNNKKDKLLGGDGHVVVYVKPDFSDPNIPADFKKKLENMQPYVYVYEKRADNTYRSLTTFHHVLTDADKTTVNGETWYALDLVPTPEYKEVNVTAGMYSAESLGNDPDNPEDPANHLLPIYANVANVCKDVFLKLDFRVVNFFPEDPYQQIQLVDVTHAYTGDHFYTTGATGTKSEAANPVSDGRPFFYVQVPAAWTSNGNKVKVLKAPFDGEGADELNDYNVDVQNGAETSSLSSVCKVYVPDGLKNEETLIIKPYRGETAGHESLQIFYQNGGYYIYQYAHQIRQIAPLVFSPDAAYDADHRVRGWKDINHVPAGDKTYCLANSWTIAEGTDASTISVNDNWTGSKSTVNVIPAGTTIKQEVTGLTAGTPYTVQMIVRGKNGATGKLSLNDATEGTATDNKTFTGYKAAGCITTDGRVEALLSGANNGWQKLEAVANATDDGKLTISLAATGEELQLSDVTLLDNANTDGHVWTKAPTSNDVTEYDLSDRTKANAFSFFDRGDNKNAIVYANANTVLGMSKNTYDVAVSDGSNYTMQTLALTDQAQDGTTASGDVAKFYASGWNYGVSKGFTASAVQFDRTFSAGVKAAVCFPFALDKNNIESMFGAGAKAYTVTAVDADKMTVTAEEATSGIAANTPCLLEPGSGYKTSNKLTGSFELTKTSGVSLSASAGTGYSFEGTYDYKKVYFNDKEHCYSFDPTLNGRFKYVSKSKGGIVKPFRAYIKEADTNAQAKVFRLVINSTTTGLVDAELNEVSTAPIYSVTGVLVSANGNRNGLPNGVYIQDGKKFVINK
ncbi:chitobiase/beta-hexosaminidase C-terminal domain-containing protein [Prevotella sp. AGR2160]|uniref:chitobiase/beta-hexosaminidase C-terminal domain-containing protein n=1 Tax=Prevotella sp. AGR2160 TaxID=1280674 RepID=UPI00040AB742|nr:FN3 associated domain-containing protein [Prevotella sp. AGR2160]